MKTPDYRIDAGWAIILSTAVALHSTDHMIGGNVLLTVLWVRWLVFKFRSD